MELFDTGSKPKLLNQLLLKLNAFRKDLTKEKYNEIIKFDKFENFLHENKVYEFRPGLYPLNKTIKLNFEELKQAPTMLFLKNEKVELDNDNGVNIIVHYKDNKKVLIF